MQCSVPILPATLDDDSTEPTAESMRLQAVEDDYLAALHGRARSCCRNEASDVSRVLRRDASSARTHPDRGRRNNGDAFSRQDIVEIIGALVLNAAPDCNRSAWKRGVSRSNRGQRLWAMLLSVMPAYEGATMERTSNRWPRTLRQRFLSGLHYRTLRCVSHLDKPVERAAGRGCLRTGCRKPKQTQTPAIAHRAAS